MVHENSGYLFDWVWSSSDKHFLTKKLEFCFFPLKWLSHQVSSYTNNRRGILYLIFKLKLNCDNFKYLILSFLFINSLIVINTIWWLVFLQEINSSIMTPKNTDPPSKGSCWKYACLWKIISKNLQKSVKFPQINWFRIKSVTESFLHKRCSSLKRMKLRKFFGQDKLD